MKPRSLPSLVLAQLPDGEAVASLPASGDAIVLNAMGSAVLELCDGSRTIEQIAAFVCEHIEGTEPAAVRADIADLVERLQKAGLLADAEESTESTKQDADVEPCGPSHSEG